MRIILTGKMGVGKDTVKDILFDQYGFIYLAFADKLKEIARELFPNEFNNGKKPRKILQLIGQKMREIEKNCWTAP